MVLRNPFWQSTYRCFFLISGLIQSTMKINELEKLRLFMSI